MSHASPCESVVLAIDVLLQNIVIVLDAVGDQVAMEQLPPGTYGGLTSHEILCAGIFDEDAFLMCIGDLPVH